MASGLRQPDLDESDLGLPGGQAQLRTGEREKRVLWFYVPRIFANETPFNRSLLDNNSSVILMRGEDEEGGDEDEEEGEEEEEGRVSRRRPASMALAHTCSRYEIKGRGESSKSEFSVPGDVDSVVIRTIFLSTNNIRLCTRTGGDRQGITGNSNNIRVDKIT